MNLELSKKVIIFSFLFINLIQPGKSADLVRTNKRNNNLVKSPNNGKIIEAKFLGGSTIVHLALNGMKDYDHLHIKIPGINYFENNQIVNLYTDVNYSYIFEN